MSRAFVYGDNIDTDLLAPGHLMKTPSAELAKHCLAALDPTFATSVRPGDILVAGRNFGQGSSREQAVESLKILGVSALLAVSFARIFFRNAINLGLPAIVFEHARDIQAGDDLRIDLLAGSIENRTRAVRYSVEPLPPHLMAMIAEGGLVPHIKKKILANQSHLGDIA